MAPDTPAWLEEAYPDSQSPSYLVEAVDGVPAQDETLKAGVLIVGIAGVPLLGLSDDALEDAFGSHFQDGVELLLLDSEELQRATVERDSQGECPCNEADDDVEGDAVPLEQELVELLEHGSVLNLRLCPATQLRDLAPEVRAALDDDLQTFAALHDLRVELHCPEATTASARLTLCGVPDDVNVSRSEAEELMRFYGLLPKSGEEASTVEVEGLVMKSLPARHRRRRKAPETAPGEEKASKAPILEAPEALGEVVGEPRERRAGSAICTSDTSEERRYFEYLDHTADVILHSWGHTLEEAFEQCCVSFFAYLTDLDTVSLSETVEVEASGHDMTDLLYHLLDEFLFSFSTEFVVCRRVEVFELDTTDMTRFRAKARGRGEKFDLKKHPQGTEIKAITMHQMKVLTPTEVITEAGTQPRVECPQDSQDGRATKPDFPYECYALVDI
ncbi:unnamed protein product [Symbiodinium natans]|uniref:Archease domain-containing protein n=1 Tax=Symbiodinium natans TaxID=878477 RepID=A0A812Q762_9DINO|nr:unnamed protein product [Symbiodinium natans]